MGTMPNHRSAGTDSLQRGVARGFLLPLPMYLAFFLAPLREGRQTIFGQAQLVLGLLLLVLTVAAWFALTRRSPSESSREPLRPMGLPLWLWGLADAVACLAIFFTPGPRVFFAVTALLVLAGTCWLLYDQAQVRSRWRDARRTAR